MFVSEENYDCSLQLQARVRLRTEKKTKNLAIFFKTPPRPFVDKGRTANRPKEHF